MQGHSKQMSRGQKFRTLSRISQDGHENLRQASHIKWNSHVPLDSDDTSVIFCPTLHAHLIINIYIFRGILMSYVQLPIPM
jgi:hypothetical protein